MLSFFGSLALLAPAIVQAQNDGTQIATAQGEHFECVLANAQRYSPAKESAADVADAAIAACTVKAAEIRKILATGLPGVRFTPEEIDAMLRQTLDATRRTAIFHIIRARYPKL